MRYYDIFNIEPLSTKILIYFYIFDLFMWISQFYLLSKIMKFRFEWGSICNMFEYDEYGSSMPNISYYCSDIKQCNNDCLILSSTHSITISISIFIIGSFSIELIKLYYLLCMDNTDATNKFNQIMRCCGGDSCGFCCAGCVGYNGENNFSARELIVSNFYSKTFFQCHGCFSIWIILYYLIRYVVFFILTFMFYDEWNGTRGSIKWYDIWPIFIVWIMHECIIKIIYVKLPPYIGKRKHILMMLQTKFGTNITSVILQYYEDTIESKSTDEVALVGLDRK
eukprot:426089_1